MLKLLKIKKSNKTQTEDEILESVEEAAQEMESVVEEILPQISLYISVDQLSSLNTSDEERQQQAMMYLRSTKKNQVDPSVYSASTQSMEKSYIKLGSADQKCPHCRREYTSMPMEVKKCLGCSKAFFKAKRPQDGVTVLVREENREMLAMQWQNIKKPDMIKGMDAKGLEKARLELEMRTKKSHTVFDVHNMMVEKYLEKSLKLGKFRLYSSLIYYKAEYFRFKHEFSKALIHYFYLYFLQINGASNSVVFGDKIGINVRTYEAINALFKMSKTKSTEYESLFSYAIESLGAFDCENLPYDKDQAYAHLVNAFKGDEQIDPIVEEVKPKRFSFIR